MVVILKTEEDTRDNSETNTSETVPSSPELLQPLPQQTILNRIGAAASPKIISAKFLGR